ncbi:MAG: hypothetical protein FJ276_12750, partial [Planctomycetes bacterium]|nr:hypothetical protein [Planctomycetota bacterium]
MATGKSAAENGNGADERAVRTFLERAAPIILASRALDEAQCDAVIAVADKLGLSRQQLLCELRLLEQRGVITSAPWDRIDARDGHPAAARDARPAPPGGPAAKSARTAPEPDGRRQLDSPRPEAAPRGPAGSDSATGPASGPPRVSSPAKRRQDQFRELALKRLGTANSMTPRLRRQLVADGTGMGLSSEEVNSVLFSLPRTTPPVPPHAVPAAPAQPAGTSPPVAGPTAHTPAEPSSAAPPVAPPPSDADSAREKPKTPPAEVFGKWVTEQLARLAADVLTADDEASLVGVGIHRFRLARVLATHVVR